MCPPVSMWTRRPSVSRSVVMPSVASSTEATAASAVEARHVDLPREVAGVDQHDAVAEVREVGGGDDARRAGDGDR